MKPFNNDGRELDAIFSIEEAGPGKVYLIVESRGGAEGGRRPPRNPDYGTALDLLLQRLSQYSAIVENIEVFSNVTRKWPEPDRRITAPGFPTPLKLGSVSDFAALRVELGRASAALGQAQGQKGGNPTKKLRFLLSWEEADFTSIGQSLSEKLESLLAAAPKRQAKTDRRSRYDPLGAFLLSETAPEVRLKLSEIASILGQPLPGDSRSSQFWANAADHHTSRRGQWLDAGYSAFYERRTETVLFRRRADDTPTADPDELRSRVRALQTSTSHATGAPPSGSTTVEKANATVVRYVRDPKVVAWVLATANGQCEACEEAAPFVDAYGIPFLEVHHVRPLSQGGPDTTTNAVAACPNCHRRMHFGVDRETFRQKLLVKISRLTDHPPVDVQNPS